MAKITCPVLFSQCFNIDPRILDEKGIFDPILNIDTKLFIDPTLLQQSEHKFIKDQAAKEFRQFCENIFSLLEESKVKDDFAYNAAVKQIQVKEIAGTCLGYGTNSITGRSISQKSRDKIIYTASEILKIGIKKPELFILLPLFEEGIGADTISDITTAAIQKALFAFTLDMAKELKIKTPKCTYNGETIEIIRNPLQRKISPILLLPRDILRKLPFASTWDDIIEAADFNSSLRTKVNHYISLAWESKVKTKKEMEKRLAVLMKTKNGIDTLIEVVNKSKVQPYDFERDEEGVMFPRRIAEIISENPLEISSKNNTVSELNEVVKTIIEQFKFLIENKGVNTLLWKGKSEPNNEKITQKIFLTVAYSYCKANDIDINPEMDSGRGNVDFKFSKGFYKKIVVEIKHSYNQKIIDGFSEQLQLYKKAEETTHGYYIIVDVGGMGNKYDKLTELYNNDFEKRADIIYVDGRLKPSASKIKSKNKQNNIEIPDITFEVSDIEFPEIKMPEIILEEHNIIIDDTIKEIKSEQ
jgi:hypothetical protein